MSEIENDPMSEKSDSESSDDEEEQKYINRAEELEKELANNKFYYEAHVELVDLYRKLSDLNSMRAAYQRFNECFPLTPTIWLGWINDEIKLTDVSGQKKIFELFDKAVDDYLSVKLWMEYAQYSIGASDLNTTRSILERGLTAAGLHVTEGSLLWDTLRELEFAHLSLTAEGTEEWKIQVNKLAEVFRRQLSVPLFNMENTYNEWQQWLQTLPENIVDPKPIEWGYKKALKTLEQYKPYEEKLLSAAETELYNIYTEYLKSLNDPSSKICLYERAAFQLCLNPNLWVDYCKFCYNLGETAVKTCSKALRNCPWSEELWILKLRILEHLEKDQSELLQCFEQGISSINPPGLDLWLSYLEYMHRSQHSVEKLDTLFNQAIQQFDITSDPTSKLYRWHAKLLAVRGDMPTARKLWKLVLQHCPNRDNANIWLEYINLEKQHGEPHNVRSLYQRALSACPDWCQFIAEEWIMYERVFGKLDDIVKCFEKCNQFIQKTEMSVSNVQPENKTSPQGRKRKYENNEPLKPKKFKTSEIVEELKIVKKKIPIEKDPSKTVFVSNLTLSVTEDDLKKMFPNAVNIEVVVDKKGKSRCFGYVQFTMEEEVMTALARDREPLDGRPVFISNCKPDKNERKPVFKYASTVEEKKLFVKGLPKDKTQEEVEEIFKPYGAVEVRLVLHKSGQRKGLAYVEFESEEAASNALKMTDQMKIDEHVISVAISAPPKKNTHREFPGDASFEPIRHARSKLQMPMIPRSLQVKPAENKNNPENPKKSNADFRNMFLKK